jgi:probable F420-dependent oxidoreductase
MSAAHSSRLGRIGAWFHPGYGDEARTEFAAEAETLGYPVAWLGFGPASVADLAVVEQILQVTSTIVVATAIVNMWTNDADEVAASYRRITSRYGDRVLLGVGIGHPEANSDYRQPYVTMVDYLDRLDAGGVPPDRRILAALGPRALRLAAARTLGTHPYLVVPEHTREARGMLGPGVVIAPEQTVVIEADPDTARDIGRAFVSNPYLQLVNYTNNFRRYGYTDADLEDGGSDRLVDALVLHGSPDSVAAGLRAHLEAGADHIGIQVLTPNSENPMPGYRQLARALL